MIVAITLLTSGCSFSVGEPNGLCEGEGCDYARAGVCKDVMTIYKNKDSIHTYKIKHRWWWTDIDPYVETEDEEY